MGRDYILSVGCASSTVRCAAPQAVEAFDVLSDTFEVGPKSGARDNCRFLPKRADEEIHVPCSAASSMSNAHPKSDGLQVIAESQTSS